MQKQEPGFPDGMRKSAIYRPEQQSQYILYKIQKQQRAGNGGEGVHTLQKLFC